jgi:hypothetical protein
MGVGRTILCQGCKNGNLTVLRPFLLQAVQMPFFGAFKEGKI